MGRVGASRPRGAGHPRDRSTFRRVAEFDAHARFAEDGGIGADVIASVREGSRPEFDDARRAAVHDLVAEYFATNRVAAPTFSTALAAIGEAALVDVVAIAGYYAMVCMTVNVFEIMLPSAS